MEHSDVRKYLLPVASGISLNVAGAYLYDVLKPHTPVSWYPVIFVAGAIVLNLAYSIILIRYVRRIEVQHFVKRTEAHHSFAHNARNLAVKLMPRKPLPPSPTEGEDPISLTGDSHYQYKEDMVLLLESMANMFQHLVPRDTKVWACIRERRSDDSYHTWARTSDCNTTRQEFSEPLHKDSNTIQNLKKSYKEKKDCVLITGSRTVDWHRMANDDFAEDLSVLMGAVLSKSWTGRAFDDPKLLWVVCINADREHVFTRDFIPLMKTCNDVLSWILNTFVRYDALKNNWPPAPKSAPTDLTA
jgi:hypothetical protein